MKERKRKDVISAVAKLNPYWNDPHKKPSVKWKKWKHFFLVAMTANYSISTTEVLRHEADRNKAVLNNLDDAVAERNCVSVVK